MELRDGLDLHELHWYCYQLKVEAYVDPGVIDPPKERKSPRARSKKLQSFTGENFEALGAKLIASEKLRDELRSSDKRQEQAESPFDNAVAQISAGSSYSNETLRPGMPRDLVEDRPVRRPQPPISAELEAYSDAVATCRIMRERIGDLHT